MPERVNQIKAFAELAFDRFETATKDLSEKEIEWRPVEEANNIRWILTHLSRQWHVRIPIVFTLDPDYKPEGWPEDYREIKHQFEKLLRDLEKGMNNVLDGIDKLSSGDLDVTVPLWDGSKNRQFGLMRYISEILHHEGQIAYIRGAIGRRREKDPSFLA